MKNNFKITLLLFAMVFSLLFTGCQEEDVDLNPTNQSQEINKVSAANLMMLLKDEDIKNSVLKNTRRTKSLESNYGDQDNYFTKVHLPEYDTYTLLVEDYTEQTPYYKFFIVTVNNIQKSGNNEMGFYSQYIPAPENYDPSQSFNIVKFAGTLNILDLDLNLIGAGTISNGVATGIVTICKTSLVLTQMTCSFSGDHGVEDTCSPPLINDAYYVQVEVRTDCFERIQYVGGASSAAGGGPPVPSNLIFENVYLDGDQREFLNDNPAIKQEIHAYLKKIGYAVGTGFAVDLIKQMMATGLTFDVERSHKSPVYIDKKSVQGNSPEEVKFREVYDKLTKSPKFKKLFVDLFSANSSINTKFTIENLPQNNPSETAHGLCHLQVENNGAIYNNIIINRPSLLNESEVFIAQTIIHEFIHAFLNVKLRHPNIGMSVNDLNNMDFVECIDSYYNGFSGNQTQHQFFLDYMAPVIADILMESKSSLFTQEQINKAENPEVPGGVFIYVPMDTIPRVPSDQQMPWNWNTFFRYMSMVGLQHAESFDSVFPPGSVERYYFESYRAAGTVMFNP